MTKAKKICAISALTALYVVLSAFLKINLIGNIMVDLGYVAFTVALCYYGWAGAIVGIIGCALESLLFSAYGFSISWVVANALIGLICGLGFWATDKVWLRIIIVIISCVVGLLGAKTLIECYLYSIPLAVKIPKNAVACAVDAGVMICALPICEKIKSILRK